MSSDIGIWIAAFLTLCVFSFLYKDNPLYKFAEHVMVGLAGGYFICLVWYEILKPDIIIPLADNPVNIRWIPVILTLLLLSKITGKITWLSRIPLAFMIGVTSGVSIPLMIQTKVINQIHGNLSITFEGSIFNIFGQIILISGCISVLMYFFYSIKQTKSYGKISNFGIYILMIGFGASFGYTVMARISLLIGRMIFLLKDWLGLIA